MAMLPMWWTARPWLLLLVMVCGGTASDMGSCLPQPSCQECIQSHPSCAWCKQLDFVQADGSDAERCAPWVELEQRGCLPSEIVDPHGKLQVLEDRPLSNSTQHQTITQLAPQRVALKLRPGEEQSFRVYFRRSEGYPVDLYYLMDLSHSMKDDLENIKRLGSDLLAALRDITTSVKIGFGAFVDKTMLPYVNTVPSKWQNPCLDYKVVCQSPFSYRHVLALTNNATEFESNVSQQRISGNLDTAEGGFDAIMQAALCKEQIGWRNVTRLLVFTSDGSFHMAGDGKLGGIYMPNDGRCHLDANGLYSKGHLYDTLQTFIMTTRVLDALQQVHRERQLGVLALTAPSRPMLWQLSSPYFQTFHSEAASEEGVNSWSQYLELSASGIISIYFQIGASGRKGIVLQDYPSIGHLAQVLSEANIQPIFAVTGPRLPIYEELSRLIPKSAVGELKEDSSNVVQLIADAYSNLSSTVNLEHSSDLPPGISIVYDSHCGASETYRRTQGGECSGVHVNELVQFTVRVKATACLPRPQEVALRVLGVGEELRVQLTTMCECQCGDSQPHAHHCSRGHGNLTCGVCSCQEGYIGQLCECKKEDLGNPESRCRDVNDTGPVCSGKGQCVCGKCQCNSHASGSFCQCDDTSCERHNGLLCAGNGWCRCGTCECRSNYTGSACACSLDTSGCVQEGVVCSGHGRCVCNRCQCDTGWFDSHCSHCVDGQTPCEEHRDCAECKAFSTGPLSGGCSASCNQTVKVLPAPTVNERWCQKKTEDGSLLIYLVEKDETGSISITVKGKTGSSKQTTKLILGLVVGLVAGLGLLLIGLYRGVIEIYDRQEFNHFKKECNCAHWNEVNNPLFRSATTTTFNPKYNGD